MSKARIALVLLGASILLLIVYLVSGNKGNQNQQSASPTNITAVASPTPILPETYRAPTATPTAEKELEQGGLITSAISFPAFFFTYPWGDFAVDSSSGGVWRGVIVSDTNWYAVSVPSAVQWCEEVVVSAPNVTQRTATVHPEVPTTVRKIRFVQGDIVRWGCVANGKILWSSVTGGDGWGECLCETTGCVVNIRTTQDGEVFMLVSPSCRTVDNSYIVRLEKEHEIRIETPLKRNWIVFGDFICAGGQFPTWEICMDWNGNIISHPVFPPQKVVRIYSQETGGY